MKRTASVIIYILAIIAFALLPWLSHAATGDIIFSYKGASGQTQSVITPSTSTDVLALDGAGLVTKIARTTWLTPATAASTYEPIITTGSLALSKLATDPLARANHTGTQAWSTITSTPTTLTGYGITNGVPTGAATSSGLTMATAKILGRSTASTGAIEELTIGSGLILSAGTLTATGTGTVTSVAASVPSFLSVSGSPITTSGTLAITLSGTALPVANGGTGITSIGSGVATWWGTPSSANLAAAATDETGSGELVFSTAPTFKASVNINNPANTFAYILTPAAIAANRILNLPLTTATDTLACLGLAQTFTADQTITTPSNGANTLRLNFAAGGSAIRLGTWSSAPTSYASIYFGTATPTSSNWGVISNGSDTYLSGTSTLNLCYNGSSYGTMGVNGFAMINDTRFGWSDTFFFRDSTAKTQCGVDSATAPVNQTIKAADGITGTNIAGGNLTIASGDSTGTGTSSVIIATPAAGSTGTTARTAATRMTVTSANVTFTALPQLPAYTVATLPSTAATGMVTGAMAYVTDATLPTYNATLTGGGAVVVPVFYNGSAWVSY